MNLEIQEKMLAALEGIRGSVESPQTIASKELLAVQKQSIPVSYQISFTDTTPAETKDTYRKRIHYNSIITKYKIQIPDGSNNLVHVTLKHNGQKIAPWDGDYLIGNDVVLDYPLNWIVKSGDYIDVIIDNGDDTNPHTIPITLDLTIIGKK